VKNCDTEATSSMEATRAALRKARRMPEEEER
jgi:hypothetical protein